MAILDWEALSTQLAYPLGFGVPPSPVLVCFEEQQFIISPPTLSALETQILTPNHTYPYTELFRSTFVANCTVSNWNVSIARTVLFYMATTGLSGVLNDFYPGLFPQTGILCKRRRTTYIDNVFSMLYPSYSLMSAELSSRGMPAPHLNLLHQNVSQNESPVYRVCAVAAGITLASILTLQGL